jgi:hypothetical protein
MPVGTVQGGYELRSIIGKGAFGITYRARDLTLSRDVAIKEYLPTALALREDRTTVLPISPSSSPGAASAELTSRDDRSRFLPRRTVARLACRGRPGAPARGLLKTIHLRSTIALA